jgi:hypothetical protein
LRVVPRTRGRARARRLIVAASKKDHYIGGLNPGIAMARVVSGILAVEGEGCAARLANPA